MKANLQVNTILICPKFRVTSNYAKNGVLLTNIANIFRIKLQKKWKKAYAAKTLYNMKGPKINSK